MVEVKVFWESQSNHWWNETCADIVEHFGLPGDRYTTELTSDWMSFYFHCEKDALLCKILISDKI